MKRIKRKKKIYILAIIDQEKMYGLLTPPEKHVQMGYLKVHSLPKKPSSKHSVSIQRE